jgi:hypothetical protein
MVEKAFKVDHRKSTEDIYKLHVKLYEGSDNRTVFIPMSSLLKMDDPVHNIMNDVRCKQSMA